MGWKDWPYWLRGGITTVILFYILFILTTISIRLTGINVNNPIQSIPLFINMLLIFPSFLIFRGVLGEYAILSGGILTGYISYLLIGIIPFIIGSIIGWIVGKTKNNV